MKNREKKHSVSALENIPNDNIHYLILPTRISKGPGRDKT
jgi:hypothetical protein